MADPRESAQRIAPDLTARPEFTAAVDAAVQARVDALLPELMAKLAVVQGKGSDDANFVQALALQLAELTGQGQGKIYVAPEIVEKRRVAFGRLVDLLIDLRTRKKMPAYRLKAKVFLNLGPKLGEVLIDPFYRDNSKIIQPQEMDWPGVPNLSMEPINAAAEQVFAVFSDWIGHTGPAQGPDKLWMLSGDGAVIRAGEAVFAKDRGREYGEAGQDGELAAGGLRRHDQPPKQKIQVLGSLTPPVEVS